MAHFAEKQERYVRYDAQMLFEQGAQSKAHSLISQPLRHFWWRFVARAGYRDGWHGLRLSLLMAWYEFRKYRMLRALWRRRSD